MYFILIDKLNKMHEKGIAHSDIKPQNIVLSFENEPFFIDFGGSIFLSDENDFKNYLISQTPNFNLKKYFEIFDKQNGIYVPRQLNKEQIKLCDLVQLSLTFLFLICDNRNQKELFFTKKYNQLFQNIIQQQKQDKQIKNIQNNMIFLFNISRILNLADPDIKLINDGNGNIFEVNDDIKNQQLPTLNNIVFSNYEKKYRVKTIDKQNIKFIYFLDKQGCKLKINPKFTKITSLPEMKEYLYISQKYEIDKYFQNIISKVYFDDIFRDQKIFHILEYLKAYKIKNLNIFGYKTDQDTLLEHEFLQKLQSLKLSYPLELIFIIKLNDCFDITALKACQLNYHVSFYISREENIMKLRKDIIQNVQINQKIKGIIKTDVIIHLQDFDYDFKKFFDVIKNIYNIGQIKFSFDYQLSNIKYGHTQLENLQFNQLIQYNYRNLEQLQLENSVNYFIKNYQIFNNIHTTQKIKIIIKFYDLVFKSNDMWLQIYNNLESNRNYYIEIITVNCLFSEQVAGVLKLIYQLGCNKVKYEFNDEYIELIENNYFLKYSLNIEFYSQSSNEKGLKIFFFNQKKLNELYNNPHKIHKIKQIPNQNESNFQTFEQESQLQQDQQNIPKIFDSLKIQQMFQKDIPNKIPDLMDIKIDYGQQTYIQRFKFINKKIQISQTNNNILIKNIENIIKNLQLQNHYSQIHLFQLRNDYCYFFEENDNDNELTLYSDSNNIDLFNLFHQLNLLLTNNYTCDLFNNYCVYKKQFADINQKKYKETPQYMVKQEIEYSSFSIQQKLQNDQIYFQLNNGKHTDFTSDIFTDKSLKDSIKHFFQHSIINLLLTKKKIQIQYFQIVIKNNLRLFCGAKNYFKIFFDQIEKLFPHINQFEFIGEGFYDFVQLESYTFNDQIKIFLHSYKYFYLDLMYTCFKYDEIKQFIIKFNDQNKNNQFFYCIDISQNEDKKKCFTNDFSETMKITQVYRYLYLQLKQQQPNQKRIQRVRINLILVNSNFQKIHPDQKSLLSDINEQNKLNQTNKINDDIQDDEFEKQSQTQFEIQSQIEFEISEDIQYKEIYQKDQQNNDYIYEFGDLDLMMNKQLLLDYQEIKELIFPQI